jgi:hypothetical protein
LGRGNKSGRSVSEERTGRANHGKLIYLCEGETRYLQSDGVGKVYGIELFLQGDEGAKITFDEDTAWIVRNDVVLSFESGAFTTMTPEAFTDTNLIHRNSDNAATGAKDYRVNKATVVNQYQSSTTYYIHYHITTSGIQMFLIEAGAKGKDYITASCTQTYTQLKPYKG